MDAVIFALRDNGVLVYVPQYGLKGPVYLESKDKEVIFLFSMLSVFDGNLYKMKVLYCGKLGPTWQRGVVTKRENFVKVETLEGTNMYRLFDHVTVGIQLKGIMNHFLMDGFLDLD